MRETYGRDVYYDIPDPSLKQATQWLISNPNRVNLGRIGLKYKGKTLDKSLIINSKQELDLWNGIVTSTFRVDGKAVKVVTQGDFDSDAVAFNIDSDLIASGDLQVELDFPYPPIHSTDYKYEVSLNQKPGTYSFAHTSCRFLLVSTIFRLTTPQHLFKTEPIAHLHTSSMNCRSYITSLI